MFHWFRTHTAPHSMPHMDPVLAQKIRTLPPSKVAHDRRVRYQTVIYLILLVAVIVLPLML